MFSLLNRRKNIQPRSFNYKPRYYDEEKEAFEARVRSRMQKNDGDSEAAKTRISSSFREGRRERSKMYKSAAMRSNIILIAVVFGLCFFVYIFLQNHLPTLIESWFN